MTVPETPPPSGIRAAIAAQLAAVHPGVPPERLVSKVGRTFLGALFVGIGLVLLALLVVLPALAAARHVNPVPLSVPLLFVGIAVGFGAVVLGATIWSSELVSAPIAFVVATLRAVVGIVRGAPA